MTIEEAIKKAMDAGYGKVHWNPLANRPTLDENIEKFFLDPEFWKSLGKAMGWCQKLYKQTVPARKVRGATHPAHIRSMFKPTPNRWNAEWHRFIDHLAAGKSTEEFFKNL